MAEKVEVGPGQVCNCPACGVCILVEEQTEAWDDAVMEEDVETSRLITCTCGKQTEVVLVTFE